MPWLQLQKFVMIISHKHKFIFLHCRKSAGSSFKISASRYLAPDDIVIGGLKDGLQHGIRPPKGMIRTAFRHPHWPAVVFKLARGSYWNFISDSIKQHYVPSLGAIPEHASATSIMAAFPQEWQHYRKICIVRNPWDQMWSEYKWRFKRKAFKSSFDEFVKRREQVGWSDRYNMNWDIYTIDNAVSVDRVIHYENLNQDMAETFAWLGIDWDGWIPNAKSTARQPGLEAPSNYRAPYTDETRAIVARIRRREIDQFNYVF